MSLLFYKWFLLHWDMISYLLTCTKISFTTNKIIEHLRHWLERKLGNGKQGNPIAMYIFKCTLPTHPPTRFLCYALRCSIAVSLSSVEEEPSNYGLPPPAYGSQVPPRSSVSLELGAPNARRFYRQQQQQQQQQYQQRFRSASAIAAAATTSTAVHQPRLSASASFHRCFQKQSFEDEEDDEEEDDLCCYEHEGHEDLDLEEDYDDERLFVRGPYRERRHQQRRSLMVVLPSSRRSGRPPGPRVASGLRHVPAQAMAIVRVDPDGRPWTEQSADQHSQASQQRMRPLKIPTSQTVSGALGKPVMQQQSSSTLKVPTLQMPLSRSSPEALVARCMDAADVSQEDLDRPSTSYLSSSSSPPLIVPPPPSECSLEVSVGDGNQEQEEDEEEDEEEFDDALEVLEGGEG